MWPRTAGKKPLLSQEERSAQRKTERTDERQKKSDSEKETQGLAIGESQEAWEGPARGEQEWQGTWSTEDVVQYVNDRLGEILPRLDLLENKVYTKDPEV